MKACTLIRNSVRRDLTVCLKRKCLVFSVAKFSFSRLLSETDLCPHLLGDAWLIGLWNWGGKGAEGTTTHHTLVYWPSLPTTLSDDSSPWTTQGSCRWGVPIFSSFSVLQKLGLAFSCLWIQVPSCISWAELLTAHLTPAFYCPVAFELSYCLLSL